MADSDIETPTDVKSQVKQLKGELKQWEHSFQNEKGRKPQKEDILLDKVIAKKYKLYSKLKSKLQETGMFGGHSGDVAGGSTDNIDEISTLPRFAQTNDSNPVSVPRSRVDSEDSRAAPITIDRSKSSKRPKPVEVEGAPPVPAPVRDSKYEHVEQSALATMSRPSAASTEQSAAKKARQSQDDLFDEAKAPTLEQSLSPVLRTGGLQFKTNHPLLAHLNSAPPVKTVDATPEYQATVPRTKAQNPIKTNTPIKNPELFRRVPVGQILRAKIVRKSEGVDRVFPTLYMINEADDKFLMAARKRKKAKNPHYLISTDMNDLTKTSGGYIAKVKSDDTGLAFFVLDARTYDESKQKKGLKDMAAIMYDRVSLPRDMKVAIKPVSMSDDSAEPFTSNILDDLITDSARLRIMVNNKPKQDETKGFGLNFSGRVTVASVKNFQLIDPANNNAIVLQFGRTGEDTFALDALYPLTPVEAFGLALTVFDAYDTI